MDHRNALIVEMDSPRLVCGTPTADWDAHPVANCRRPVGTAPAV